MQKKECQLKILQG